MRRGRAKRSVGGLMGGLLLLIALFVVGIQLVKMDEKLETARLQEQMLQEELSEVEQENQSLADSIEKKADPEEIERVAREELDMAYPDEKVFYATGG